MRVSIWMIVGLLGLGCAVAVPRSSQGNAKSGASASPVIDEAQFLPNSELISDLLSRKVHSNCTLTSDSNSYTFVLDSAGDQVEYVRRAEGLGESTGSTLEYDSQGGLDAVMPVWVKGKNLNEYIYRGGQRYYHDRSGYGTIWVGTFHQKSVSDSSLWHHFIGKGSRLRFDHASFVRFSDKEYRGGGFALDKDGFHFLTGTEVRANGKTYRFDGKKWKISK